MTRGASKYELMVGARLLAVLEFGLCHGCSECHIPQRGSLTLVSLSAFNISQERFLRDALAAFIDSGVGH